MKGNKMCRLHLILLYVCLILCTGCISGERKDAHVVTDEWKIKQMELLLENDPGTAMDKMDSLLPYLKDSMSYYRGIVFKSKAYMLMSRIGDASRMLRQAGSFCTSPSKKIKAIYMLLSVIWREIYWRVRQSLTLHELNFFRHMNFICIRVIS